MDVDMDTEDQARDYNTDCLKVFGWKMLIMEPWARQPEGIWVGARRLGARRRHLVKLIVKKSSQSKACIEILKGESDDKIQMT